MKDKIILVTGATGKQGGATARHLLQAGVKVRALTRKPDSKNAQVLQSMGIEVVKGDLNDSNSLDEAMKDVNGVFSVTNFWEFGTGKKEIIQSKNLTDTAKKHHVQHLVLASIARCDDNPNLAHFVSKYESEQYIQQSSIPYTFLRAVYFMDNLKPNGEVATFHWGILPSILGKSTTIQMISCEDIGWFAANALLNPTEWIGKTMDIAGDNVTYPQTLEAFKNVFGSEPKRSKFMTMLIPLLMSEIRKMFEWYKEPRFHADITALRKMNPNLQTIEDYFRNIKNR